MIQSSEPVGKSRGTVKGLGATFKDWNVAVGNFFFRYRNVLFPGVFLFFVLVARPTVLFGSPVIDLILTVCGAFVAVAGQLFRLLTIGFEYIHRGGKDGQVYASRLVQGGVYATTRNPMYVGNALIAIGMAMMAGSPVAYVVVIPFFLFVYQAIVAAEEEFLRRKFGGEYEEYSASVNRFFPSFRGVRNLFSTIPYDWKRAIRKDLSTIMGLLIGLISLPVWRTYFLRGFAAAKTAAWRALIVALSAGVLYGLLAYLKKQRRLF